MSDKKIIDMDDLLLDNISLDDLTSLPGVPDAANDWKHKGEEAPVVSVNQVDELDISSVDLSSLDPEQEDFIPKNNDNGSLFTAAPIETESVQSAESIAPAIEEPVKKHSAIDDIMSKYKGGFEVKSADEVTSPSVSNPVQEASYSEPESVYPTPKPMYTEPVTSSTKADEDDIIPGLDFKLPQLKKVSLSGDFSKTAENVSSVSNINSKSSVAQTSATVKTPVTIPDELPPLKPKQLNPAENNYTEAISVEIPGMKKSSENSDLPPLKPHNKTVDNDLPPLKPRKENKSLDDELPPLKPRKEEKKPETEEEIEAPAKSEENEDDRFIYVAPKTDEEGTLPADMSDVAIPKLDDMMATTVKKAAFEQPENKIEGMADPFANKNISAARRKKLEEGFDEPVVMKKIDPETYWEIENNEKQDRINRGKNKVTFLGIMYIVFTAIQLMGNLSVVTGIAFAISLFIGIKLIKGPASSTRIVYLIWGLINSGVGFYTVYSKGFIGNLTADRAALGIEGWFGIIAAALQILWFIISLILIFTNKNVNEFFRSLKINKD